MQFVLTLKIIPSLPWREASLYLTRENVVIKVGFCLKMFVIYIPVNRILSCTVSLIRNRTAYTVRYVHLITGTGCCRGARYGGGRYCGGRYGGRRYGRGRLGRAFQFGVGATAEPPDTHITMDATAGWGYG